jgi:hypothetical protein
MKMKINEMEELLKSFVSNNDNNGAVFSYDKLIENENLGWFCMIEESMNDKSNKIINFIIATIGNHSNLITVQNDKKQYAYEYIMKSQVSL